MQGQYDHSIIIQMSMDGIDKTQTICFQSILLLKISSPFLYITQDLSLSFQHSLLHLLFFKWTIPGIFMLIFLFKNKHYNSLQQIYMKNVHPIYYGAGIRTRDLQYINSSYPHSRYHIITQTFHLSLNFLHISLYSLLSLYMIYSC